MKNNQGFTLLSVLAMGALLSVIAVTGMSIVNQNAKKEAARGISAQGTQLVSNVSKTAGASVEAVGKAEFQKLPPADPNDINDPNHPDSPNNPGSTNNLYNPNNSGNPNHPENTDNPNHTAPCNDPCHISSKTGKCMISDIDCQCLGFCPICPNYEADGPLNPKYKPIAEGGQGLACPGTAPTVPNCHRTPTPAEQASGIIAWNDGDLLQCGCTPDAPCPVEPIGKGNTCPSPKTPQCLCPGGMSDCPDVPVCGPGYVLTSTGPWSSTCAPIGSGTGTPVGGGAGTGLSH